MSKLVFGFMNSQNSIMVPLHGIRCLFIAIKTVSLRTSPIGSLLIFILFRVEDWNESALALCVQ